MAVNLQVWNYWACSHSSSHVHENVAFSCDHKFTMCQQCYASYSKCPKCHLKGIRWLPCTQLTPLPNTTFAPAIAPVSPDNWNYWACNHSASHAHEDVTYTCDHKFTMCQLCYEAYGKCPIKRDGGTQRLIFSRPNRPDPLPNTKFSPALRPESA